jgi:CRP/FNR family cyclic AMP-dependent transcriptional regulator
VDAERLKSLPLFGELSPKDRERIARWADEVDVAAGRDLMKEGAFPHEFMVIESGTAEVTHDGDRLAELGPGDFFGEMALLEHIRRTATVTATSDLRIIVMHERDFREMEHEMPEVARRIRATMDERRARAAGATDG